MSFSEAELSEIIWGDHLLFDVIRSDVVDNSRWSLGVNTVLKSTTSAELFIVNWRKGATEYQDHEYPNQPVPAEAYVVTETKYRIKKPCASSQASASLPGPSPSSPDGSSRS